MRNSIQLIIKLLKRGGKEVPFFVIITAITAALMFNLINVINAPELISLGKNVYGVITYNLVLVIGIAFFILANANAYLVKVKSNEIGIEILSGISNLKLGILLTIQNAILNLIGYAIGIIGGCIISPIVNAFVFGEIFFKIYPETFLNIVIILFLEAATLGMINQGFGYRNDIKVLLGLGERNNFVQERYKKELSIFSYFCFILMGGIVLLFLVPGSTVRSMKESIILLIYVPVVGGWFFYKNFLPKYIEKKKRKSLNSKFETIVYSNLKVSILKNKISYFLLIVLSGAFPSILFLSEEANSAFDKVITLFFIVAVIMIVFMIIFNAISSNIDEIKALVQLRVLGYSKEDIIKIMRRKIGLLFLSLLGCPIYIQSIYILYLISKMGFSIISGVFYIAAYLGIFLAGCMVTYYTSLKALKENL